MLKEILYKWFGLELPVPCNTCEVLRERLAQSDAERRELLNRLLDRDKPEPVPTAEQDLKPIQPQYVPWRVRQQMLEAEDRHRAQLLRAKEKEKEETEARVKNLEEELEVS